MWRRRTGRQQWCPEPRGVWGWRSRRRTLVRARPRSSMAAREWTWSAPARQARTDPRAGIIAGQSVKATAAMPRLQLYLTSRA